MSNVVLVGSPKANSTTLRAAQSVAHELFLGDTYEVIDIVTLGGGLLSPVDDVVESALERVFGSTTLIVASPTYKGTYTGLLKLFLDRLPGGSLGGTTAFPMMLGAGPWHALAPELTLRPVLVELGASCPVRGLYLTEDQVAKGTAPSDWLHLAHRHVRTLQGADHDPVTPLAASPRGESDSNSSSRRILPPPHIPRAGS